MLVTVGCGETRESRRDLPYSGAPWPDRPAAHSIDPRSLGIVSNVGSDSLSLIDLGKNEVVASPPIDIDPIGLDGPHHVVIDGRAEHVYTLLTHPTSRSSHGPHAEHAGSAPGTLVKLRVGNLARVAALDLSA